jgi:hypothetical protein
MIRQQWFSYHLLLCMMMQNPLFPYHHARPTMIGKPMASYHHVRPNFFVCANVLRQVTPADHMPHQADLDEMHPLGVRLRASDMSYGRYANLTTLTNLLLPYICFADYLYLLFICAAEIHPPPHRWG